MSGLSGLSAVVDTRWYRANKLGERGDEISSGITGATLALNQDALASQWVITGTTLQASLFDRLFDYVIPTMTLYFADGTTSPTYQLGHHRIRQTPKSHLTSGSTGGFTTEDLAAVANRYQLFEDYTVPAGTNPGTLVADILVSQIGFAPSQLAIPPITSVTSADATYHAGDAWAKVYNDALEAVGYRTISMDKNGKLTTAMAQELDKQSISTTYNDDNAIGTVQEDHDDSRLRNVVTVRRITPGMPTITWTAKNEDASSPLNIHGPMGQLAAPPIDEPQLADEATARARAEAELSYGSSFYSKAEIRVVPDPAIDLFQIVQVDIRDQEGNFQLDGKFAQRTADMPLGARVQDATQGMRCSLNRVTPLVISGGSL